MSLSRDPPLMVEYRPGLPNGFVLLPDCSELLKEPAEALGCSGPGAVRTFLMSLWLLPKVPLLSVDVKVEPRPWLIDITPGAVAGGNCAGREVRKGPVPPKPPRKLADAVPPGPSKRGKDVEALGAVEGAAFHIEEVASEGCVATAMREVAGQSRPLIPRGSCGMGK
mmetsp:Transcript_51588/g.95473  ORF Transcript_51588/g.95473 Transcript_51588/m.95473 type:complete len:167 (+) Transcript_51588:158-658(+)